MGGGDNNLHISDITLHIDLAEKHQNLQVGQPKTPN